MSLYNFQQAVIAGASGQGGVYSVSNSIVLDDGSSQYMSRTPSSAGNRKTWTYSVWVKRGLVGSGRHGFLSTPTAGLEFDPNSPFDRIQWNSTASAEGYLLSNEIYRDPHAWYHVVIAVDTTEATDSNRIKVWVNNTAVTWASTTWPTLNQDLSINNTVQHTIGLNAGSYFDGYLSEAVLIDGTALDPTSFGEYSPNGIWRPIDVSGLTFGTNGFYLPFTDSTWLGKDANNSNTMYQSGTTSDWTGSTSVVVADSATREGYVNIASTSGQDYAYYSAQTLTGDFNVSARLTGNTTAGGYKMTFGVFDAAEDGTFGATAVEFNAPSMTKSFYLHAWSGSSVINENGSATTNSPAATMAENDIIEIRRSGSTITMYLNGALEETCSFSHSGTMRLVLGGDTNSAHAFEEVQIVLGSTTRPNNVFASGSPTQSSDTPTNNHIAFTPLALGSYATLSNGNKTAGGNTATDNGNVRGSIVMDRGHWNFEFYIDAVNGTSYPKLGVIPASVDSVLSPTNGGTVTVGAAAAGASSVSYEPGGSVYTNGSLTATYSTFTAADKIGMEVDIDNGTIKFRKNGSLEGTALSFTAGTPMVLATAEYNASQTTLRAEEAEWDHTPTTGALALNSVNLYSNAAPAIKDGTAHFDVHTRTGTGAEEPVTAFSFAPSLSYIKKRNGLANWLFNDLVRGAQLELYGNLTLGEATQTQGIKSFDANGYTLGTAGDYNNLNDTFVDYAWKGDGTSGSTNSDGSIDSTINVNTTAGFVVGKYTTPSEAAAVRTVGHGLGAALDMLIVKNLSTGPWQVWHTGLANEYVRLNATDAKVTAGSEPNSIWNAVEPGSSSTTFSIGTNTDVNGNAVTCSFIGFRSIPGYSAFGSYTGNASTDGPLILLDFTPAFVLIKFTGSSPSLQEWTVRDNARDANGNPNSAALYPDTDGTETDNSSQDIDFLSDGFKIRTSDNRINTSGGTFIYAAFAEHPFAGATPATAR